MKIDINKQYRTRTGNKVLLFTDSCPGLYPVVGAWYNSFSWVPCKWTENGNPSVGDDLTLVEVKPKSLVYINLYDDPSKPWRWWSSYDTKAEAEVCASHAAIAVGVPVYIEEKYKYANGQAKKP